MSMHECCHALVRRLGQSAAVLALGTLLAVPATPAKADDYDFINIATASTSGSYYPAGLAIAKLVNDHLGRRASAQSSAGSVENVSLLRGQEANMAIIQNNVVRDALNGTGSFEGNAFEGMEVLAPLFTNTDHIVVRAAAGIETLADAKGKRWAIGSPGSGTMLSNLALLGGAGLGEADIEAEHLGQTEALAALQNGLIDGADVVSGVPFAQLSQTLMASGGDIVLLGLDPELQARIVEESGWKTPYTIPAGTYEGQDEDILTTSHLALIIVPSDFPDDLAYDLLKTMHENLDELREAHGAFGTFDLEKAAERLAPLGLPINGGSQRFFDELG